MSIDFTSLAVLANQSAAVSEQCSCDDAKILAWQKMPLVEGLELSQFVEVGTLVVDPYDEPTFAEYHSNDTDIASEDAPIAPLYYPTNRSQVLCCAKCGRHYLRYTEGGGYFTEMRIRALRPSLLVDARI